MSFLKKEVKRIGYLAKPLHPPSSLYETTYSPPQVLPAVVPFKKRRRMSKSPVEYFYEEPYHELMKKMEKEEVQQQAESVMRALIEEQQNQEMTRRFLEEQQQMTPEKLAQFQSYVDLWREAAHDKNVAFGIAKLRADEKVLREGKDRLLEKISWLNLDSPEEMEQKAKEVIMQSKIIDDKQKRKLLDEIKTPEQLAAYALTLKATPSIIRHNEIRILTDLLREKLKSPIDSSDGQFYQVKSLLENTFGLPFTDFQDFRTFMGPSYQRRRIRKIRQSKKRQ